MEAALKSVIQNLIDGTRDRSFEWEVGSRTNSYLLKLEKGTVSVSKWVGEDDNTGDSFQLVDILFTNNKSEEMEREIFSLENDETDYRILSNLHDTARKNAKKFDLMLSEIYTEIQKRSKVPF